MRYFTVVFENKDYETRPTQELSDELERWLYNSNPGNWVVDAVAPGDHELARASYLDALQALKAAKRLIKRCVPPPVQQD